MPLALILAISFGQTGHEPMRTYFQGEAAEAWAFDGLGVASIGSGVLLVTRGTDATRGASVPLFAVGLIQLVLGIGLGARTPGQVAALEAQADYAPAERTRMARVMRGFGLYKAIEVGLFFGGVGLAGVGGVAKSDFALGAGLSLGVEALAMLILDFFAEARGRTYESALLGFRF
jgi:hypothetical protein